MARLMSKRPSVYVAHKMTGRYCDELYQEAQLTTRMLTNYGFDVLDPIVIENVPNEHVLLEQTDPAKLLSYWKRDKECLQDCHLVLDYKSCNKSDGVGVELGITRFAYWKPVIRVFPNAGICISKIEYDQMYENLLDAVLMMMLKYGSMRKLLNWRIKMLVRSLPKFIGLQIKFLGDIIC